MEKVTFTTANQSKLIGYWYQGVNDTAVILSHGFVSNKTSSNRFTRIAERYNQLGFTVLTFDFGGCGESPDAVITLNQFIADLEAAKRFTRSRGYQKLMLYGHSLGGLVTLNALDDDVLAVVLTGPVTGSVPFKEISQLDDEQKASLEAKGFYYEILPNDPWREKMCVSQSLVDTFENVNQDKLWRDVKMPVLIIHGTQAEEKVLKQSSERVKDILPEGSRMVTIEGADHGFFEQFDDIERMVVKWLIAHTRHNARTFTTV